MLSLVVLVSLLAVTCAQYPYQTAPGAPPAQSYHQPQQQSYQQPQQQSYQQPQPQAYHQPQPQPRPQSYNPAPVHYVNIGAQLQGDYKFGYDTGKGADGQSFREETRLPDGTVQGAYGYVDASGKQRIVKYTAGKDGFKAEGDVGPDGVPQGSSPGPAPQPVQNPHGSYAPQGSYSSPNAGYGNSQNNHLGANGQYLG